MSRTIIKCHAGYSIDAILALPGSACDEPRVACPPDNDLTREFHVASETRANPRIWTGEEPRRGPTEPPATRNLSPAIDADEALDEELAIVK